VTTCGPGSACSLCLVMIACFLYRCRFVPLSFALQHHRRLHCYPRQQGHHGHCRDDQAAGDRVRADHCLRCVLPRRSPAGAHLWSAVLRVPAHLRPHAAPPRPLRGEHAHHQAQQAHLLSPQGPGESPAKMGGVGRCGARCGPPAWNGRLMSAIHGPSRVHSRGWAQHDVG